MVPSHPGPVWLVLSIFVPESAGYGVRAINLVASDFKPGATMLFNTAPTEVAVKLDGVNPVAVRQGSSQLLTVPPGFKENMISVQIYDRKSASDPWRIAQSTRWPVDNRFRSYLFFYNLQGSNQLCLHGITERIGP
ncbi:hypothetical protein [Luteolibacter sp. LG18]|uniref:hypothetical protein n=1 Tax=Luteolibacter sp. LG18 TaxID=2819286 RepID=UPI002B29FAB6|nr:hypothetical protein llg_27600 [Luteolibacter sp. LG18]